MTTARERARCRERLEKLSESDLDSESMRREALAELQSAIGFDRWCWPLADPDTLIPLGALAEHDYGPAVPRSLELEYSGEDVATMHGLARRSNPAGCLSAETGGDLACSPRWDEVLRPVGIGDEAVVACRDEVGCWGWLKAYRDNGDARFAEQDIELLQRVGPALGSALRRSMSRGNGAGGDAAPSPAGVIVLDGDLKPVTWTAGARDWINSLPSGDVYAAYGMLPAMVYPVATRARSGRAASEAHALERAVDGRWVMIEAAPLEGRGGGAIAVTLRDATAGETFDRLCRIYALSQRERQIVALLVAGLDTRGVTRRLFISPHTVQDHLKSVFAKVGTHSRRELLVKLSAAADGS